MASRPRLFLPFLQVCLVFFVLVGGTRAASAQGAIAPVTLNAPVVSGWSTHYVDLSWTPSDSPSFASYQVYRATHPNVTEQDTLVVYNDWDASWTSETVEAPGTAPPGTTYYFRVFVTGWEGQSAGSNEVSITQSDAVPAAVTLNTPTPSASGQRYVDLSWSRSGELDFRLYRIYRATHPNVTQGDTVVADVWDRNQTEATVEAPPSPAPGTTYYFRLFVVDEAGQTAGSNEVSITQVGSPPAGVILNPPTPSGAGQNYLDLSWSQSTDADFSSYEVYRATHPNVTQEDTLVASNGWDASWTWETVEAPGTASPGTTYYFRVFVTNGSGLSAGSNEVSYTQINALPSPVTLNAPTRSTTNLDAVDLSWSQNADADFTAYRVYRATHPDVTQGDTLVAAIEWDRNQTTATVAAPGTTVPGTTYYFRVFVIDDVGQAAGSNEVSITQIAAPEPPGAPTFSDVTQTTLTATLPELPIGATSLSLQRKQAAQPDAAYLTLAQNEVGGASVAVTGLYGSTDYAFRCIAVGPGGSTPGAVGSVTTASVAPPQPGLPTFSELTEESVKVTAPVLPPSTTYLKLQMKTDAQTEASYADIASGLAGGDQTLVNYLDSGTTYDFRCVAVGPGGSTAGPSARLVMAATVSSWQAGMPINCGGIRWPVGGSTNSTIHIGGEAHLSSFLATDWDQRDVSLNGQLLSSRVYSDTCSYTWSMTWADGTPAGRFKGGINKGQGVVWIPPSTPGMVTLRLVVDDQNGANQGNTEVGARNDATRGYDDEPETFTASISVQP